MLLLDKQEFKWVFMLDCEKQVGSQQHWQQQQQIGSPTTTTVFC